MMDLEVKVVYFADTASAEISRIDPEGKFILVTPENNPGTLYVLMQSLCQQKYRHEQIIGHFRNEQPSIAELHTHGGGTYRLFGSESSPKTCSFSDRSTDYGPYNAKLMFEILPQLVSLFRTQSRPEPNKLPHIGEVLLQVTSEHVGK